VVKIAKNSPQLEIKMLIGCLERNTETIRINEKDVNQSRQYYLPGIEYLDEYISRFS
jgi:hypothetical protein